MWGIDLGGTKIELAVLDSSDSRTPKYRERLATEAHLGYEHILEQIAALVRKAESDLGPAPELLGIGTPGVTDPVTGLLKNSNTVCLNSKPLKADLEAKVGKRMIMANDANCFALAETRLGAAAGAECVFGVIMGTGVGGGVVVNGKVLHGLHGIAGEWGHNVLERDGQPCYCGKRGCVETVLSGPALERYFQQLSGEHRDLRWIAAHASSNENAAATIQRLCEKFGQALAVIVNILDPDAIVLGGGVGNVPELYSAGLAEVTKWVFNSELRTQLLRPKLGDSAGSLGAALLSRGER